MESTSVKEIVSSNIIAEEATLSNLNIYFESHNCLNLQCNGKAISSNISTLIDKVGEIKSANECKVKVRVVYSANNNTTFEMELRKADCAGRVGGSSILQCNVKCVDPQLVDSCCPQNKILGESRCCNISTCNGKCYYNNSCANETSPCSLPNKCGICVSPGKDFNIGKTINLLFGNNLFLGFLSLHFVCSIVFKILKNYMLQLFFQRVR